MVEDPEVPPNYSVRVSDDPKVLHLLYWGGCLVARCRTEDQLIAAIDAHLAGHGPVPDGAVRFSGLALRRGSAAVLLTHVDQQFGAKLGGRLRGDGVSVDVRPWIDVLAETLELLPPGSVGLSAPGVARPQIAAAFLPAAVVELPAPDQLMTLQRSGAVHLEAGTLSSATVLLSQMPTESVENYEVADVAEALRSRFAELDGIKRVEAL